MFHTNGKCFLLKLSQRQTILQLVKGDVTAAKESNDSSRKIQFGHH